MLNFLSDNNSDEAQFHLKPLSRIRRRNAADTTAWTTRCVTESETPRVNVGFHCECCKLQTLMYPTWALKCLCTRRPECSMSERETLFVFFTRQDVKLREASFITMTINQQTSSPCSHRETVQ